jgi:hypothetical protein
MCFFDLATLFFHLAAKAFDGLKEQALHCVSWNRSGSLNERRDEVRSHLGEITRQERVIKRLCCCHPLVRVRLEEATQERNSLPMVFQRGLSELPYPSIESFVNSGWLRVCLLQPVANCP